ncbi:MgtC/SapB family protein [Microbulbifer guangxiensis]|uniref:MgtC/SapB family protein n=1 Tax=Microbulbifer guangxiensis TaxID=2904249 RepID=UPI001F2485C6|nr:MgtC/SapB family protein [Microbulbifer guangxiensis]
MSEESPAKQYAPAPLQDFVDPETLIAFGIALGLGLLIGLQRERSTDRLGGIRTFPLIALFGALTGRLTQIYQSPWILAVGILCMTVLILLGNLERLRGEKESTGVTTEISALMMYLLGVFLVIGEKAIAVALGGTIAVLLHLKPSMHQFAQKLPEKDLRAIMQFALISLIILPVLPNQTFGPYDVLNPFKIWLLVVLIVGIGLGGYGAYKLVGARAGTLLSGVIGGLISSTATTVSYARRARENPGIVDLAALVILIASTTIFVRMFVEIAVVAPRIVLEFVPPLATLLLVSLVVCALGYRFVGQQEYQMPEHGNPAELTPALIFGGLYALVLMAIAAAKDYFGNQGIYVVALISGFTDVDAITLSTANLANQGSLHIDTAWRAMIIATLANMVFKAGAAGMLGGSRLFSRVLLLFALPFIAGLGVIFFWPVTP